MNIEAVITRSFSDGLSAGLFADNWENIQNMIYDNSYILCYTVMIYIINDYRKWTNIEADLHGFVPKADDWLIVSSSE